MRRIVLFALIALFTASNCHALPGARLRMLKGMSTIILTALPAGTGSVIIAKAADDSTLATLTAVGQSVSIPLGTVVYAKTSQAETWVSVANEDYNGYKVMLTGAADGAQSINTAIDAYYSGWGGTLTGSAVCQTGNATATATATGSMSVAVVYVTGP